MAELSPASALASNPSVGLATFVGLDRIGTALADPIRRSILIRLIEQPQYPSGLAESIGTSRSNLSNHLACLRGCGLIHAERTGRQLSYRVVSTELADALRTLMDVAATLPACEDHNPPTFSEDAS